MQDLKTLTMKCLTSQEIGHIGREFASVESEGTPYMTPQDFLESVTDDFPRPRIGRIKLKKEDIEEWLESKTPPRSESSSKMFRKMHNKVG